ncbi:MAG: cytochrome C [Gammaproteobacteria bacterium]|nr:cytochrome C [Gammaproteobacteria bacterium]NNL44717.1 cytochrome C [Woeseiaceae bacterium]
MRSLFNNLVALCALIFLSACDQDNRRQGDIYLPEGDAARGEMHFVSLGCVSCHSVIGAELPEPAEAGPVRVLLGSRTGPRPGISYGHLVTSIVNPSHRLSVRYHKDKVSQEGESLMTTYNDVLTVTQLTDLVAFLQAHYEKADRPGYKYPTYTYKADDDPEDADPQ